MWKPKASKKQGGPMAAQGSATELAQEGPALLSSDSYNPFADNPFADSNPFAGDSSAADTVEAILRDHAAAAAGGSGGGAARVLPPAGGLELGGRSASGGSAGGGSARRSGGLTEVPLYELDAGGGGGRAGGGDKGGGDDFRPRLPLGNPFLAATPASPAADVASWGGGGAAPNPFEVEDSAAAAVTAGEGASHWARRGSAAAPYEVATPPPQPAAGSSRRGLAWLDSAGAWGADAGGCRRGELLATHGWGP